MIGIGRIIRQASTQAKKNVKIREINKILISNRGEIACRVMQTARRLGVRTVAVYSEADKNSLHTQMADEAYCIGPAPSQQSYLRGDKVLEVAKKSGCHAIHPGYGFLSENTEFAELCEREQIVFMGPPASAIRDMGIKSTSKHIMSAAGVPIIKGYHGDDQSDAKLVEEAKNIGFPIMIKAVRGGGGKGMRVAEKEENFMDALNSARTESEKSFGDSSMLLERYVRSPRHVEVQIFGDQYGDAVYLFERDCSVQRRHQKIIEEAPAPGLSENLRKELGEAAVRAAKAVGYVGAGTVEFILDKEDLSFHFMEMNTRLQVEHPITEMITGVDLVEWQIRVAAGEPLPLKQDEIRKRGHAFEARIYAENPREGFLPGAGSLVHLTTPETNSFVRVETGVREGDEVSVHYDPMIAKLVVWGENRVQALDSLVAKLSDYHITGLETNVNFLIDLARNKAFRSGEVHTAFIDQHFASLFPETKVSKKILSQAGLALFLNELNALQLNEMLSSTSNVNSFVSTVDSRINYDFIREFKLKEGKNVHTVCIKTGDGGIMVKTSSGDWSSVKISLIPHNDRFTIKCNFEGSISNYSAVISPESVSVFNENGKTEFELVQPKFLAAQEAASGDGGSHVTSPMPGVLEKLVVKPGDKVEQGDTVAVIIAMKMEYVLKAPCAAIVKSVHGNVGENIKKGAVIVNFETPEGNGDK